MHCWQSFVNGERAARRIADYWPAAGLQNAVVDFPDAAAVHRTGIRLRRLQRGAATDGGAAGGYRYRQRRYRRAITGEEPRVAMLSFSSNGSARHPNVANVQQATEIVRQRAPQLMVDGELQFDAAFVPDVAAQKRPPARLKAMRT